MIIIITFMLRMVINIDKKFKLLVLQKRGASVDLPLYLYHIVSVSVSFSISL